MWVYVCYFLIPRRYGTVMNLVCGDLKLDDAITPNGRQNSSYSSLGKSKDVLER